MFTRHAADRWAYRFAGHDPHAEALRARPLRKRERSRLYAREAPPRDGARHLVTPCGAVLVVKDGARGEGVVVTVLPHATWTLARFCGRSRRSFPDPDA